MRGAILHQECGRPHIRTRYCRWDPTDRAYPQGFDYWSCTRGTGDIYALEGVDTILTDAAPWRRPLRDLGVAHSREAPSCSWQSLSRSPSSS